jgi:3-hydroxyacyl-CoA dehydrogenase/enoyl-CoA hydratase/3-hydroxybutyryl-CoA epimerase
MQARKQLARKARPEHYPAPYAILDMWARHGGNALAAPDLIAGIVNSPTARNLVRVFHLQERLKSFGKDSAVPIRRVHVVGAGVMGGDIAAWCALRGLTVTLQDMDIERIAPAIARAKKLVERRWRDDPLRIRDAMDRLIPDPSGSGVAHADVVIEAIVENLEIKQQLFARLEAVMAPDALLASNTSSLRLSDLQAGLKHPERLVGIHFFNPVAMMPLVEVIEAPRTTAEVFAKACAFVRRIDKLPLPVKDAPGFLVNAVLGPYLLEAMRCVDEGIPPATIDAAMLAFGMPMGPIELADTVGLDVALHAGRQLAAASVSSSEVPTCLLERVERGELGRKSGRGFYAWQDGRVSVGGAAGLSHRGSFHAQKNSDDAAADSALAQRLIRPLLARTQQLVADGVVADADLADAGVIFGTGFAPFTGGPLNYLRT